MNEQDMIGYTTIAELVRERQAKEIAYARKQLASWEWNLKNTSLPEASLQVACWKERIESILPQQHAMELPGRNDA